MNACIISFRTYNLAYIFFRLHLCFTLTDRRTTFEEQLQCSLAAHTGCQSLLRAASAVLLRRARRRRRRRPSCSLQEGCMASISSKSRSRGWDGQEQHEMACSAASTGLRHTTLRGAILQLTSRTSLSSITSRTPRLGCRMKARKATTATVELLLDQRCTLWA